MPQMFHPWVVCEYRHSWHIPYFLLCAHCQLFRLCTSALLSSASCVSSTLRWQLTSIFDICESIQNHPCPNHDSSKNRLFFPSLVTTTCGLPPESSVMSASSFWQYHTHTYLNLVQLACLTPMLEDVLEYNIHFLCRWLIPFPFFYPIQLSCREQMDWDLL